MESNNPEFPRRNQVERHGMSRSPEYFSWKNMKSRCYDPKQAHYASYGGRGIMVCDQWRDSFITFFEDMGKKPSSLHSIERIDNDGNYEPGNCKWALPIEQCNNQRTNRRLSYNGKTQTVTQWAREIGISESLLRNRLDAGWDVERSLTEQSHADDPLRGLAKRSGLPRSTFHNRLKRGWNLEQACGPRQQSGKFLHSKETVEAIRRYRADGHTLQQTAEEFKCSNGYVSRLMSGKRRKHN